MASQFRRLAAVLLSSTVLAAVAWAPANAQTTERTPVYLEADSLTDLQNGQGYLARGAVRAQQGERTLLADELEYYPDSNRVIARGNVVMHGQGAFPQYADEVELDSELSAGIALSFATMLENNGRMAAATAIRSANGNVELNDAYYTACHLCADGSRAPTWR
ncbi:MAG: LPS-assembly protein LptD, partial [Alphaproteobacteria bacterium]|nr:LPS-assembly protein LptD [Alphaproteobacteria bacterium]